jgi:hypothetical protein
MAGFCALWIAIFGRIIFQGTAMQTAQHTAPILQHLKKYGQLLDSEIAAATGIPLQKVRTSLIELSDRGEISRCSVTRFHNGKSVEAMQCRVSGYVPPSAPGRKPGIKS